MSSPRQPLHSNSMFGDPSTAPSDYHEIPFSPLSLPLPVLNASEQDDFMATGKEQCSSLASLSERFPLLSPAELTADESNLSLQIPEDEHSGDLNMDLVPDFQPDSQAQVPFQTMEVEPKSMDTSHAKPEATLPMPENEDKEGASQHDSDKEPHVSIPLSTKSIPEQKNNFDIILIFRGKPIKVPFQEEKIDGQAQWVTSTTIITQLFKINIKALHEAGLINKRLILFKFKGVPINILTDRDLYQVLYRITERNLPCRQKPIDDFEVKLAQKLMQKLFRRKNITSSDDKSKKTPKQIADDYEWAPEIINQTVEKIFDLTKPSNTTLHPRIKTMLGIERQPIKNEYKLKVTYKDSTVRRQLNFIETILREKKEYEIVFKASEIGECLFGKKQRSNFLTVSLNYYKKHISDLEEKGLAFLNGDELGCPQKVFFKISDYNSFCPLGERHLFMCLVCLIHKEINGDIAKNAASLIKQLYVLKDDDHPDDDKDEPLETARKHSPILKSYVKELQTLTLPHSVKKSKKESDSSKPGRKKRMTNSQSDSASVVAPHTSIADLPQASSSGTIVKQERKEEPELPPLPPLPPSPASGLHYDDITNTFDNEPNSDMLGEPSIETDPSPLSAFLSLPVAQTDEEKPKNVENETRPKARCELKFEYIDAPSKKPIIVEFSQEKNRWTARAVKIYQCIVERQSKATSTHIQSAMNYYRNNINEFKSTGLFLDKSSGFLEVPLFSYHKITYLTSQQLFVVLAYEVDIFNVNKRHPRDPNRTENVLALLKQLFKVNEHCKEDPDTTKLNAFKKYFPPEMVDINAIQAPLRLPHYNKVKTIKRKPKTKAKVKTKAREPLAQNLDPQPESSSFESTDQTFLPQVYASSFSYDPQPLEQTADFGVGAGAVPLPPMSTVVKEELGLPVSSVPGELDRSSVSATVDFPITHADTPAQSMSEGVASPWPMDSFSSGPEEKTHLEPDLNSGFEDTSGFNTSPVPEENSYVYDFGIFGRPSSLHSSGMGDQGSVLPHPYVPGSVSPTRKRKLRLFEQNQGDNPSLTVDQSDDLANSPKRQRT